MKHLIDKDTLVSKIEKRIKETESMQPKFDQFWAGQISAFKGVLKFLDTLEVKEDDFVEELDYDDYMTFFKEHPEYISGDWGFEETWTFGQYCYELGLKAKGK